MCAQIFKKLPRGSSATGSTGDDPAQAARRAILGALLRAALLLLLTACQRSSPAASTGHSDGSQPTATQAPSQRPLRVAAAADVEPAFRLLGDLHQQRSGRQVVFSFAGSVALSQQIQHGAPFDLYAAASVRHVEALIEKGAVQAGSLRRYARGGLVLWTRTASGSSGTSSTVALPGDLADLARPQYGRIAIANPDHAPYGVAAVQALQSAGIFDVVKSRLVFGENIRQAHQFVATGNADIVLDARSLAIAAGGPYVAVPQTLYQPLEQALGVVKSGDQVGAQAFVALLLSDDGQAVLRRFGFASP